MVSPIDSMEAVATTVAKSGELPSEMSLLLQEADTANDDADVDLPLMEIQPIEVDDVVIHNDDLVDYIIDEDGNRVGRVYQSEYEMTIQIDIWTTKDDGYDPDDLGETLRRVLYQHSSYGIDEPFVNADGENVEAITYFRLNSGERADDILMTPTVRRWSQEVELWAYETFKTTEDYIASVDYPTDISG